MFDDLAESEQAVVQKEALKALNEDMTLLAEDI